jgi:hypothetical protein
MVVGLGLVLGRWGKVPSEKGVVVVVVVVAEGVLVVAEGIVAVGGMVAAVVVVVGFALGFALGRRTEANSVTTAPPREWPTSMMDGSEGQCMAAWVRVITAMRSDARVVSERSGVSSFPPSAS